MHVHEAYTRTCILFRLRLLRPQNGSSIFSRGLSFNFLSLTLRRVEIQVSLRGYFEQDGCVYYRLLCVHTTHSNMTHITQANMLQKFL